MQRCSWVKLNNAGYVRYHDEEWGRPLHDDHKLFELLILECFQAGLSWECVLNKREAFRQAFDNFELKKVANYGEQEQQRLMEHPGVIRNRLKIAAATTNAKIFLELQEEFGSFDHYLWSFTGHKVVIESCDLRTTSPLSEQISKDLKRRGMKFVGSTVIYSYLQAAGLINGHMACCDLHPKADLNRDPDET